MRKISHHYFEGKFESETSFWLSSLSRQFRKNVLLSFTLALMERETNAEGETKKGPKAYIYSALTAPNNQTISACQKRHVARLGDTILRERLKVDCRTSFFGGDRVDVS